MTTESDSNYQYQVGLSLPVDAHTYVRRQADQDLLYGLLDGKFCCVLNSRQTGKSSLLVQTMHSLQAQEIECAAICISCIGEAGTTEEQWYAGLLDEVVNALNLSDKIDVRKWWREHKYIPLKERLIEFFEKVLLLELSPKKIVILIDEIDSVLSLSFLINNFFELIHTCYKKREHNLEYTRLTFAIFGVATLSELIGHERSAQFNNIIREIELSGFDLLQASQLEKGLKGKVSSPRAAVNEVLEWTGGQPLLTNKLCKVIQDLQSFIPKGQEKQEIEKLVRSQIIDNWEQQDNPEHLQTIRSRILEFGQRPRSLLELYREILNNGEMSADGSQEQLELRLSGLVKIKAGKLKVANKIYPLVFNQDWVNKELSKLFPYIDKLKAWLNANKSNNSTNLLRGEELFSTMLWKDGKENLSHEVNEFIKASVKLENRERHNADIRKAREIEKPPTQEKIEPNKQGKKIPIFSKPINIIDSRILMVAVLVFFVFFPGKLSQNPGSNENKQKFWSSGESRLFLQTTNLDLNHGIEAFKSSNYPEAIKFFEKAVVGARNDPEAEIYLNNAKARKQNAPFTLAVVVPVDNQADLAKEILRGVADAQSQFNKRGGLDNRLLEVVIANDGNNSKNADIIAKQLAAKPEVLGVIVHNTSQANFSQLSEYEKAGLPIISISSTHLQQKDNIFSTVPSVDTFGKKLAEYGRNKLNLKKVVICYDKDSNYSTKYQEAFKKNFTERGGEVKTISLRDNKIDEVLKSASQKQVQALVLLPSIDTTANAISVAVLNSKLLLKNRLKLLGGDTLYHPDTLTNGGSDIEGLILAVPWYPATSYADTAEQRWGGKVGWRTASSYDATQILIKALFINASRQKMIEKLGAMQLSAGETSGYAFQFSETGERSEEPLMVKAVKGKPSPTDSKFGFQLLK